MPDLAIEARHASRARKHEKVGKNREPEKAKMLVGFEQQGVTGCCNVVIGRVPAAQHRVKSALCLNKRGRGKEWNVFYSKLRSDISTTGLEQRQTATVLCCT